MLPNYQARSPFVLKHTTSMYICMYVWMDDGTYASQTHARVCAFSPKNTAFQA